MKKMVMFITGAFLLTAVVLYNPYTGYAAAPKYAYVDVSRVFDAYQKTKNYDDALSKKFSAYEAEHNKRLSEIQDMEGRLSLLKEQERKKLQADIQEKKNALAQYDREQQTELRKERDEKIREILAEIEQVINDFAKKGGYTMIFNARVLVYADDKLDVTEQVIKLLNNKKKK